MLIDLSLPIREGQALAKGHPPVERVPIDTHERDGKSNTKLSFSIHTAGTHVDAPWHFFPDRATVDEIPLEQMMGEGVRFDLRHRGEGESVTAEDLRAQAERLGVSVRGKVALLNTGWSDRWYSSQRYYGHGPYLSLEAAQWLVSQGIRWVGLDMPPGKDGGGAGTPYPGGSRDLHLTFLGNDIPIVENLTNLDRLPQSGFTVIAFPVKVYRGDGAPARVVAVVGEETR